MKTISCYSLILVLLILTLSKCSNPEEPGSDGQGEAIPDEQRLALLEDIKNKAIELNNLTKPEDRAEFIEWISRQPHITNAGYAEEDIYAVFDDDRVMFFVRTPRTKARMEASCAIWVRI